MAVKGFRKPESYSDVFKVLEENKIISKKFSSKLQSMSSFRNILLHRYPFIDRNKLLEIAKEDVKDIEKFVKIILKMLK
ncbi:MAG: HepT-like ribonuclease domain-containing protein [Candidatus Aenigmatarchaeota archaeon]